MVASNLISNLEEEGGGRGLPAERNVATIGPSEANRGPKGGITPGSVIEI